MKEIALQLQAENLALKKRVREMEEQLAEARERVDSPSSTVTTSIEGLEVLLIRFGPDGLVQYVNTPFLRQFGATREDLLGKDERVLRSLLPPEMAAALARPEAEGAAIIKVADSRGGKWEVRNSLRRGIQDVVIEDVTHEHRLKSYVQKYVSLDLAEMTEEDLGTFKFPERRFMTVSFTDLRGFTAMSETMPPEEVRSTINAYLEAVIRAVDENRATVDKIVGDEVMALYGAPRWCEDHAVRAILTALLQIENLRQLQAEYRSFGKVLPDCGIGINTGDMVVGNMGGGSKQNYTVLGSSVNLAARLCGAAKGGEVLLTEATLRAALANLPESWEAVEATNDTAADTSGVGGKTESVFELPAEFAGKRLLLGPGLSADAAKAEIRLDYLYAIKVKGVAEPLPVILATRLKNAELATKLRDTSAKAASGERIFGKYRLLSLLGRGGMGEVWKARDAFGNVVAVKSLLAGEGASEAQIRRFKREAAVMSKLQHRHICRINEVGEVDKVSFIAMELVDGVTLSALLKHAAATSASTVTAGRSVGDLSQMVKEAESLSCAGMAPAEEAETLEAPASGATTAAPTASPAQKNERALLPLTQSLALFAKICEAVQHAHERGILHRDLKPANIMIRPTGDPVVMDFGLAKFETDAAEGMSLSLSGQIVGTIEYMAPEQARSSKTANEASDVYSLGAILYQLLTGARHFSSSGSIIADAAALENHSPIRPRALCKDIDPDLETIVLKALRADPKERYPRVQALYEDLRRYERGEAVSARPVTSAELFWKLLKRNKLVSGVIVASFVIIVVGVILSFISINRKHTFALQEQKKAMLAQKNAEQALEQFLAEQKAREQAEQDKKAAVEKMAGLQQELAKLRQTTVRGDENLISQCYRMIMQANDREIRGVLRQVSSAETAAVLKDLAEDAVAKIYKNMSRRAQSEIEQEVAALSTSEIKKEQLLAVQKKFLEQLNAAVNR